MRRSLVVLALVVLVLVLVGCPTSPPPGASDAVVSVTIDQGDVELVVGSTTTLSATVEVVGGASDAVVWSSEDEAVATVNAAGVVTAVAEGEATVVATSTFDDARSASVTVTVVPGGVDDDVLTVVAPVAPLPGSSPDALMVVTPFAEYAVESDVVEGAFLVAGGSASFVALMDTERDFGWSAIYPYWFADVDAASRAAGSAAASLTSAHEVGPLSTAVSLVLLTPNVATQDPEVLPTVISVLRSEPAVLALAAFLDDHSAAPDPLAVAGFAGAYETAIDAAVDALNAEFVSSTSVQPAAVTDIDAAHTAVSESNGLVSVAWSATTRRIDRTVTHLGVIYEVDTTAYGTEHLLHLALVSNEAPALVSNAPVARIALPAEDPAAVIDVIGFAIGVVFDAVFGYFGPSDLPEANERTLPEGAYVVHLQACATMRSPVSLAQPIMANYRRDLEVIFGWPGSSAVSNAVNACALFAFENAVDTVSLVVDVSDFVSAELLLKDPWPDVWGAAAEVLFDTVTDTTSTAWSSAQFTGVAWIFTQTLFESAATQAANAGIRAGMRAWFAKTARALASKVNIPGKISRGARLFLREVQAGGITPLESSLVIVGHPWPTGVTITPQAVVLAPSGEQAFTARVEGASDTSVTWEASCGSITGSGNSITYTAPATAGNCEVTATSVADPAARATARVSVSATGMITGSFLQIAQRHLVYSLSDWRAEFRTMQSLGMDTVIVQYGAQYFGPGDPATSVDYVREHPEVIRRILDAAAEVGLDVWLGLGCWHTRLPPPSDDFTYCDVREPTTHNGALLGVMIAAFGEAPAWVGIYLPEEIDDISERFRGPGSGDHGSGRAALINYLSAMTAQVQAAGLSVMISPYFSFEPDVEAYATFLARVLRDAQPRPNVVALQDGVGARSYTDDEMRQRVIPMFERLGDALRQEIGHSRPSLWANVEVFREVIGPPDRVAGPIERLATQLGAVADHVDKIVMFEFSTYMSPQAPSGHAACSRMLLDAYQRFITHAEVLPTCKDARSVSSATAVPAELSLILDRAGGPGRYAPFRVVLEGDPLTSRRVEYRSENPDVATIDHFGTVVAQGIGTTSVFGSASSAPAYRAAGRVVVDEYPPTGIVFGSAEAPITEILLRGVGDFAGAPATTSPVGAAPYVTYVFDDPGIARCAFDTGDPDRLYCTVVAIGTGETVLTARSTVNPDLSTSVPVIVVAR